LQGFFLLLQPLIGVHELLLGLVEVVLQLLHLLLQLADLLLGLNFIEGRIKSMHAKRWVDCPQFSIGLRHDDRQDRDGLSLILTVLNII